MKRCANNRSLSRRSFTHIGALAALAACSVLAGCGNSRQEETSAEATEPTALPATILLPAPVDARYAGIVAARARGIFEELGLQVDTVEMKDELSALEEIQAAHAEYAVLSQETLAGAFGAKEPYSVLAIAALVDTDAESQNSANAGGYPLLLVANDTYLVRRDADARLVVDAVRQGYLYAANHPGKTKDILEEHFGTNHSKRVVEQYERLRPKLEREADEWGIVDQKRWDTFFESQFKEGAIERPIPAHHGFSTDYLFDRKKK